MLYKSLQILFIISLTLNSCHKNKSCSNTIQKKLTPVLGHRLSIIGNFSGNKKSDTLTEVYLSQVTNKETHKNFKEDIEYDSLVSLISVNKPKSYISSSNPSIDSLHISSASQLFGISFLKNEGDLNNDGIDDVSYVVNWADWSNLNTYHLVSFQNHKWIHLHSFPIWEWQLQKLTKNEGLIKKTSKTEFEYYYRSNDVMLDTSYHKFI